MTNWAAIGIVAGAEVAVLLGATIKAFSAQARLERERDDDIRAAVAGYESGLVQPALANLVEAVIEVRRDDESIVDALSRAEETNRHFAGAVRASIRSQSPRACERALVHRYNRLGICLTASQIAGPIALFNVVTGGYNLPSTVVIAATVIFGLGVAGSLVSAVMVRAGENALSRAIREGKDVA